MCILNLFYCHIYVDPNEVLAVNHTLEVDVYSGVYNFTAYFSLPRRDPLLLATILWFKILLNTLVNDSIQMRLKPKLVDDRDIRTVENKVTSLL